MKMTLKRKLIKELLKKGQEFAGQDVLVKGWIRSLRKSKTFSFAVLNDGSCQNNLQVICDESLDNYEEVSSMIAGYSVAIKGTLVQSQGKGQNVELQAKEVEVIGKADASYPLQKKGTSLEFLREKSHLRHRTNLMGAMTRLSHAITMATHLFFDERGFYHIRTPIITNQDAEGAGEMFKVSTFDFDKIPTNDKGEVDYKQDYFGEEVGLCVTGQLQGEAYACGMGGIYTFGPTFRSENSNTPRHLSEFWMIEPEVAFAELEDVAELAADYIKYLISFCMEKCPDELEFLNKRPKVKGGKLGDAINGKENHLEILKQVAESDFKRITYTEAIEILQKSDRKFEFPVDWGSELQTEHERYLAEEHFKGPIIVTDYPKSFKAFYMKQNPDGKTVRAMDVLVPGVGEIIGGSEREADLEKLEAMMVEKGMEADKLWWYLELRKYGTVPHGGFGLGMERALLYISGMSNIREAIPFPRTPKNASF
jgi:asparaginyl-tRNA synthetase